MEQSLVSDGNNLLPHLMRLLLPLHTPVTAPEVVAFLRLVELI